MDTDIVGLISKLSPAEQSTLLDRILKPTPKKKTHVSFRPVDQITIDKVPRVCISKKDAIRNLGEVMLVDIDKMSIAEIKTRAVGLLMHLAETEEENGDKKKTLAMAARIVLEEGRDRLMYKVATLAAYEGGR